MTNATSHRDKLRPLLRVGLWTLVGLALFELAWLGFFQWIESSGQLRGWANRRPDKVRLDFDAASSIWPGLVELNGLVVRGRTARGVDWQVTADRVEAQLALLPLTTRRLVVRGARIAGVEVRSLRPAAEGEADLRRAAARAMRPMEAPPLDAAPSATPSRGVGLPIGRAHSRWAFEFHRLRVTDMRSITIDDSELTGNLRGELGFAVRSARGEAEIFASRVEIADLLLRQGGAELARKLGGTVEIALSPYRYREERGRALLPHTSGHLQLRGLLDDRPLLAELLRRAPWLAVDPGIQPFVADLRLARGRLLAGSRLDAERRGRKVRALDFTIDGDSALSLVVDRVDGVERARWQLLYEAFTVHREGITAPLLAGSGLAVAGVAQPPDLADLAERSELRLELGSARLPDIAFLAEWLPPGARLESLGGSAEVKGSLAARVDDLRPSGEIEARFDQLAMRWAGIDLTGRLEAKLVVAGGDLAARRLELGGTRLLLADFAAPGLVVAPTEDEEGQASSTATSAMSDGRQQPLVVANSIL
jgi:hypothetical protein